jgi:hypothetical protein
VAGNPPPPLASTASKSATYAVSHTHPNLNQTHTAAGQSYTASGRLANAQNPHLHYPGSTPHAVKTSLLPPITYGPKPGAPDENVSIDDLARLLGLTASSMLSASTGNGKNGTGSNSSSANLPTGTTAGGVTSTSVNKSSLAAPPGGVVISTTGGTKTPPLSPVLTLKDPNDPNKGACITINQAAQILGKKRGTP